MMTILGFLFLCSMVASPVGRNNFELNFHCKLVGSNKFELDFDEMKLELME